MINCSICSHKQRAEIELALLNAPVKDISNAFEQVAEQFYTTAAELKLHAVMHTPSVASHMNSGAVNSLARQLKIKEADALSALINDYLITLTAVGRRIRSTVNDEESMLFEKKVTKSVTDLYLGTGSQVRDTVKLMAEINSILNEDQSTQKVGMVALADALNSSVLKRTAVS